MRNIAFILLLGAALLTVSAHAMESLFWAVAHRDGQSMQRLLDEHADPNERSASGKPALLEAVQLSDEQMVYMLLRYGADPNVAHTRGVVGDRDVIPLRAAVRHGSSRILTLLLNYHADPNMQIARGETALHAAVSSGNEDAMRILLEFGANPNLESALGTPLHKAAIMRLHSVAELLLSYGAHPDSGEQASKPLHNAIETRSQTIILLLLTYGADLHARNENGETPEQLALRLNHISEHRILTRARDVREHGQSHDDDTDALMAVAAGEYDLAATIMQQRDASLASHVLLQALILEGLRDADTRLRNWIDIQIHRRPETRPLIMSALRERANGGYIAGSVFMHALRRVSQHTNEYLGPILRQPYAMIYQILHPSDIHEMLYTLGQRIARKEATPFEVSLAWERYQHHIKRFRDGNTETFIDYLARAPRYSTYLRKIIRYQLERALIIINQHDCSGVIACELAYATAVARGAGNRVGAQVLQSARALFSSTRLDPESIDHFLAFLPNAEDDAAVEQQQ